MLIKQNFIFRSKYLFIYSLAIPFFFIAGQLCYAQQSIVEKSEFSPAGYAKAANELLGTLSPSHKKTAHFSYDSPERLRWHNLPSTYRREGLKIAEMSVEERIAVHGFLHTMLSPAGFMKLMNIMRQDQNISEQYKAEKNNLWESYGMGEYKLAIFGDPSATQKWAFRFEGHHFSLNFHFDADKIMTTPMFIGANPALELEGLMAGTSHVPQEEHYSWQLLHSLSPEQLKQATYSGKMPDDIQVRQGNEAWLGMEEGLLAKELTNEQKSFLLNTIAAWVGNLNSALAAQKMSKIAKNLDDISFMWAGGKNQREARYFIIKSDDFSIELDNRSYQPNHIHSVWWEFPNLPWKKPE